MNAPHPPTAAGLSSTLRGFGALAAVVAAIAALRLGGVLPSTGSSLFGLGFLVLAGTVAGRAAQLVNLPRVTGYLLAGVLAGPQGFALIGDKEVTDLSLVNGLALALIALSAGAELTVSTLRSAWKSVVSSALVQALIVVPLVGIAFWLLAPRIPFLASLSDDALLSVALLWGVVALSRSPSVTLAVLQETKAKGPLTNYALGVIISLDLVVLVLFAFSISVVKSELAGVPFELSAITHLGSELFASVAAGTTFGLLIALYYGFVRAEHALFLVVIGYAITAFTHWFGYETLLVFVVAGFVVMNLTRFGPAVVGASERLGSAVMVVFFATAGAKIDIDALRTLWPIALALVALRIAFTYASATLAARVARDPPVVRQYGWLPLVSQAGVTIGLATIVADSLPEVGGALASLAIAVIGVNELLGPIAFKYALTRAGEIPPPEEGKDGDPHPSDPHPDAPHDGADPGGA